MVSDGTENLYSLIFCDDEDVLADYFHPYSSIVCEFHVGLVGAFALQFLDWDLELMKVFFPNDVKVSFLIKFVFNTTNDTKPILLLAWFFCTEILKEFSVELNFLIFYRMFHLFMSR